MESNNLLLQEASKSLETLLELKNFAVRVRNYELGAECRELEKKLYPETEAEKIAQKEGERLRGVFGLVDLNISQVLK